MKVPKIKRRMTWAINPITRVVPSKKNYKRTKAKDVLRHKIQLIGS